MPGARNAHPSQLKRNHSFATFGVNVQKLAAVASERDTRANFSVPKGRNRRASAAAATAMATDGSARARLQRSSSFSGRDGGNEPVHDQEEDILGDQAKDPDAEWKQIQVKTFTRWCNQHLKKNGYAIDDLATGFDDGLKLICLVESLVGRPIGKYNKTPTRVAQRLENVGMVLKFLEFDEGLRLVNIGNTDIVMDHNLKLILGLIWHLILHYQVSLLTLDDGFHYKPGTAAKDMLLMWLRSKLAPREVRNLTSAWNDGKLLGALVNVLGPGLFPDADRMNPANKLETATKAMQLAEDWLGVPQVLQPSDLINPKVDEKSMITYLSYFPRAQLKDGAPVGMDGDVEVYGPALEGDVRQHAPSTFTIDASKKLKKDEITWQFYGPSKPKVTSKQRPGDDQIVDVTFQAAAPGTYTLDVKYGGVPIADELQTITVVRPPPKASKVRCNGPGLQSYASGEDSCFQVDAGDAGGTGLLQIGVEGTACPAATVLVEHLGDYIFDVRYVCQEECSILVHVQWHGQHVPGSPFRVVSVKVGDEL